MRFLLKQLHPGVLEHEVYPLPCITPYKDVGTLVYGANQIHIVSFP